MNTSKAIAVVILGLALGACSSTSANKSCGAACAEKHQVCAAADGTGDACGACLDGFALDGLECTTLRTCSTLGCAGQGRACTAGGPRTHAACGACLGGAVEVAGACEHLTCGATQSTASLTSACDVLHRACVEGMTGATCGPCLAGSAEMSGTCVVADSCVTLGCEGRHRSCVPATTASNATCGPCQPGFVASGVTCVADAAATCAGAGVANIARRCESLHRGCTPPTGGGATCAACTDGFVADPATGTCLEKKSCADLACDAEHRVCADAPTGHCAACEAGFVEDAGKCRAPTVCFDAKTAPAGLRCPTGQQCVPPAGGKDAYCRPGCPDGELWNGRLCAPCPKCDGDGEDGQWPWATAGGVCICKTKPGTFYSVAGAMGAVACDADGDGWLRESARSAMTSKDPSLQANARCTLRSIDRFVYVNEAGQRKTAMLPAALELFETDRNDDDTILAATWAERGLPADRGDGPLGAAELNRLTKLCRSPNADYNDNGAPDVYEWGGAPPAPGLRAEQVAFNASAYFAELYWGAYEAASGGAAGGPGQYVIHEKSRLADAARPPTERVPLVYRDTDDPSWRTCPVLRDAAWNKQSPPVGMDYADLSAPGDSAFAGLNHESQFKCLVVDPQPTLNHPNALPAATIAAAGYRTQLCEVATAAKAVPGNAALTELSCAALDATMARAGDVLWAGVPYLSNGAASTGPAYQRGCVSACADPPADKCAGPVELRKCIDDPAKFGTFVECKNGVLCSSWNGSAAQQALLVDVGGACVANGATGRCGEGKWGCVPGPFGGRFRVCQGVATISTEVCNGVDDNCDGAVDNIAESGCDTGRLGACRYGELSCSAGTPRCEGAAPRPEICGNGVDEDCDGEVDDSPEVPVDECPSTMIVFYADHDRDGWPTNSRRCLCKAEGDFVIPKSAIFNETGRLLDPNGNLRADCCDEDTRAFPGAGFREERNNCFSYDQDCNGLAEKRFFADDSGCSTGAFSCGGTSGTYQYTTPECGAGGYINNSCSSHASGCHRRYEVFQMQQCK